MKVHFKKKIKSNSSRRWLERQLKDPYVEKAKKEGYRSRAAFKLLEMDDRFHFFKGKTCVVDLGAAPGGWSQVAYHRLSGSTKIVIGLDLKEFDALEGVQSLVGDFREADIQKELTHRLKGYPVDVVMSDMAASACGIPSVDHLRIMDLLEQSLDFAIHHLVKGGHFIGKVLRGGAEKELLIEARKHFEKVVHVKPPASRKDSAEMYLVALNFHGNVLSLID
jgi:23S rRNA (uridine2552-2'-O)-methyltransferase